ncbi:SMR family transporter [Nonomuraea sp. NPDC049141]|uniref:SMR family transporter n=1 Tax=Nonomuraea sp. NPDC049141 TaxID=3155500 RepID=UPI0033FBC839
MNTLPVGTAYVVFTGIGTAGAITLGIPVNDDPISVGGTVALALIVEGIVLARVTT